MCKINKIIASSLLCEMVSLKRAIVQPPIAPARTEFSPVNGRAGCVQLLDERFVPAALVTP